MKAQAVIACVFVAAPATPALADIAELRLSALGRGQNVRITMGERSLNAFAGQLVYDVQSATGRAEQLLGSIQTYCTDLYEHASWQAKLYELTGLAAVPDSDPMSRRQAEALRDIYALADGLQSSPNAPNEYAAAFQIAVWEIVSDYDGSRESLDATDGWFRARSTNGALLSPAISANLDSFFGTVGSGGGFAGLVALRSDSSQDQLAVVPGSGALAAFTASGLLIVVPRRRR